MVSVLIKKDEATSDEYGEYLDRRKVEDLINTGFVNINKQSGPTSHIVSDTVKKVLEISKAGHSGTLEH